jgi:hypothetical protein
LQNSKKRLRQAGIAENNEKERKTKERNASLFTCFEFLRRIEMCVTC